MVSSCEKGNDYNNEPDPLTKEELAIIFTTYSDEEIRELDIYIDPLIIDNFSPEKIEELVIKRLENFSSKDAVAIAINFFDEYRSIYNSSYLDNSFNSQEDFAGEYINSHDFFNSDDSEFCDWPDPNCNLPIDPPPCPERPENNFITLQSRPCVYSTVLSDECGKQFNTTDCDYIYDWSVTVDEHDNPENYRFYWWTDNILYRVIYGAGQEY